MLSWSFYGHGNSSFVDFNDVLTTGRNASNVPSNHHQPCSDLIDCCDSDASITCAEYGHWYHQMDMEMQIFFTPTNSWTTFPMWWYWLGAQELDYRSQGNIHGPK